MSAIAADLAGHSRTARSGGWTRNLWFRFSALMICALILRGPLSSIPAITTELRADPGLSVAFMGILNGIPILCFGFLTPLASVVLARLGTLKGGIACLALIALGLLLRMVDHRIALISGTVVLGAGTTLGNLLALYVIAQDFARARAITAASYTAMLNIGSMIVLVITAPIATWGGWQMALGAPALLALLGGLLWAVSFPGRPVLPAEPLPTDVAPATRVLRSPLVLMLGALMALHLVVFYSFSMWLPSYLQDRLGMALSTSGSISSVMQGLGLVGSFGVPALTRWIREEVQLVLAALSWVLASALLWFAPGAWPVWSLIAGYAAGAGFTLMSLLSIRLARNPAHANRINTLVQSTGYSVAAVAPSVTGLLHERFGWGIAVLFFAAAACLMVAVAALFLAMFRIGGRDWSPPEED